MVWNVQGTRTSFSWMKKKVKKFKISLVAVLELFHKEDNVHKFAHSLAFTKCCLNAGQGGKIWVMWEENCIFDIVFIAKQMITGWYSYDGLKILLSVVYAKCGFYD